MQLNMTGLLGIVLLFLLDFAATDNLSEDGLPEKLSKVRAEQTEMVVDTLVPDSESHIGDKRDYIPKTVKRILSSSVSAEQILPQLQDDQVQEPDEIADISLESTVNGGLKLKFKSHGRQHKLDLKESKLDLSSLPIKLLGMSTGDEERVRQELKTVKMMKDKKSGATLAVRKSGEQNIPIIQGGLIQFGEYQFDIKPDERSHNKVKVRKQKMKKPSKKEVDGVPPKRREKREAVPFEVTPVSANVELVLVIDYSVWTNAVQLQTNASDDLIVNLLVYFAHMVEIMDDHYNNMKNDDIKISVDFAGVVVFMDPDIYPGLVEDFKTTLAGHNRTVVDFLGLLTRLSDWQISPDGQSELPPYDHVMLFTAYDIYDETDDTTGVLGVAWKGTICDPSISSSIIETGGSLTYMAAIATHELGHSLGSSHDAQYPVSSLECEDKNFIMSATAGASNYLVNRFLFSCCSQRSFYATLQGDHSACLQTNLRAPNFPEDLVDVVVSDLLPGQLYDADDQCYLSFGTAHCGQWAYELYNITECLSLYCTLPSDTDTCQTSYTAAADGTDCGDNSWCYQGECVQKGSVDVMPDQHCNVRDCYGEESKCENGTNLMETSMFMCYQSYRRCDGYYHCTDQSDEFGCENSTRQPCPEYYTMCEQGINLHPRPEGVPSYCVLNYYLCDGMDDCTDGYDELNCYCGSHLNGSSGTIAAPNYPDNYQDKANCSWTMAVDQGYVVMITFPQDFYIETSSFGACVYDNIEILDSNSDELLLTICGRIFSGESYTFNTDVLEIRFTSDATENYPGWMLIWSR